MVDGLSALVAVLTPDGTVDFVNRQVLDYFGKTVEELKEWASTDAVHPDDLSRVIAVWTRSLEDGKPYDIELRQRGADNVYRWFHVQGLPVRDEEGRILRWCVLQANIDERKLAEEALRESERELRQLVDSVPGMIAVGNAKGESEYLNKRALDYLDTTADEFGERPMTTVHPDDQELLMNEWMRCNELGQPLDLVHRVRRFDGVYRWVHVRGEPLLDDRGRSVRWYYVFTDIDDQKRAEEALRESEHELRQIIDSVPGIITTADSNGQQDYGNKRFLDYTGATADAVTGLDGLNLIHPDEKESVTNEWLRVWALGQPLDLDHRLKRFDGVYRWMHVRVEPLLDDRGRIVRWYGLLTDIDDQRKAEQALRRSEDHLRLLVETIPALVSRSKADGSLDYVDRRVVDYTGREMEEISLDVIHPDDQVAHVQKWRQAMETGEPWDDTYRIRRADGEFRWFYDRVEPLRDAEGRVASWYAVKVDIHDSREMEEALRSTRRKLSTAMQIATVAELSASIAHEINQPLASVVTNAHAAETWLSHDPPNLERARATLERIIRDGHSAAEVVRRIRALFKEAAPIKALLEINQIVAEVLRVLSEELRDNGIVVDMQMQDDLPTIEADRVQIQQTLINLVHNAIEAMAGVTDRAKSLRLSSWRQGEELLIQVRDNGSGIKDDPALIFEPFFTTKGSGMGMGLSISRSIVEAHGGRIWATVNEDDGMTFSFTLSLVSGLD